MGTFLFQTGFSRQLSMLRSKKEGMNGSESEKHCLSKAEEQTQIFHHSTGLRYSVT